MAKASPVHLSRRGAFGAAAAGAALTAATFSETSSVWAQTRNKATFVLVHPAWFGGWCWKKITPLLRARGYEVFTPTLTGLGERAHLARPEIGLNIHIEDVANLLKYEDLSDVILVGNSSAGMVITGVADQAPDRPYRLSRRLRATGWPDHARPHPTGEAAANGNAGAE
jgi:pimeloyl-ACP methyl ester carboxylesterase